MDDIVLSFTGKKPWGELVNSSRTAIECAEFGILPQKKLWQLVTSTARLLSKNGVRKGDGVALALGHNAAHVISILACWACGAFFVPLDEAHPKERLRTIIDKSQPKLILTRTRFASQFSELSTLICLWDNVLQFDNKTSSKCFTYPPNDLHAIASVFFTSGSTGHPKGVIIEHAGIKRVLHEQIKAFKIDQHSRILWFLSLAFDASLSDIGTALLGGATLVIPDKNKLNTPRQIERFIIKNKITHADLPPALLPLLNPACLTSTLVTVIIGGEVCKPETVRKWARNFRVINVYGPTEATICTSLAVCKKDWQKPNIGKPFPGIAYKIINGELCIGGDCVARGYFGDQELSDNKFYTANGRRFFRTGDRVRRLHDGSHVYLGRIDRQIKIAGKLLAPEEVENIFNHVKIFRQSAVFTIPYPDDRETRPRLSAVIAVSGFNKGSIAQYKKRAEQILSKHLPGWMHPQHIQFVKYFPVLPSGKPDYEALCRILNRDTLKSFASSVRVHNHSSPRKDGHAISTITALWAIFFPNQNDLSLTFDESGGDSLMFLELLSKLESMGLDITPDDLLPSFTLNDLIRLSTARKYSGSGKKAAELMQIATKAANNKFASQVKSGFRHMKSTSNPVYFMTGASGFLGSHLLAYLLENSSAHFMILSRTPQKILLNNSELRRVHLVRGDISQNKLGLSDQDYKNVSEKCSCIIHCASETNLLSSFRNSLSNNFHPLQSLLKLAQKHHTKILHHISTLSVFVDTDFPHGEINELSPLTAVKNIYGTYAQSKWVADYYLRNAISQTNLPVTIYRPSLLSGNSKNGMMANNDVFTDVLKFAKNAKYLPDSLDNDFSLNGLPVNVAAEHIGSLILAGYNKEHPVRHIFNRKSLSYSDLLRHLKKRGIIKSVFPQDKWNHFCQNSENNHQVALRALCRFQGKLKYQHWRHFDLFKATGYHFKSAINEHTIRANKNSPRISAAHKYSVDLLECLDLYMRTIAD